MLLRVHTPLALSAILFALALAPAVAHTNIALERSQEVAPEVAEGRVPPADPDRGLALLYGRAYQGFGLSADELDRLWTVWPRALREAAEALELDARRALARERYGLPLDPARESGVPVAFAETAPGQWTLNCLACHGGDVGGVYVPGLGNSRFAFQTLVRDVLWLRRSERVGFTEQERGMATTTLNRSDGTTDAQVFSAVLLAFRTPDLERREAPDEELLGALVAHDLDAPPLWNTRFKERLYCDGYVAKDPRVIMQFTLALENDGARIRGAEDDFRHVLAWIESLSPPAWPHGVDGALAARGQRVFEESCAQCHGTYGEEGRYPERFVPLADVGTDPIRATGLPVAFKTRLRASWLGRFGAVDVALDRQGYVAPPLHGIWASAPYFHNGAVPTLWHVLHPEARPTLWRREPFAYDTAHVGLVFETRETLPPKLRADERRQWFDSSLAGKDPGGHEYPSALDEDERAALLEYLKTL